MTLINQHDINDRHLGLYTPGVGNTQFADLPNVQEFITRTGTILKRCGFQIESGINISTGDDQWFWRIGQADFVFKRNRWTTIAPGYSADCHVSIDWLSLIDSDDLTIERTVRMAMSNTIEKMLLTELLVEVAKITGFNLTMDYLRTHYSINQILKPVEFQIEIGNLINQEFIRLLPDDRDTRVVRLDWDKITVYTSSIADRPTLELTPDRALVLLYELRTLESDLKVEDLDNWHGIIDRSVSEAIGFPFLGRL